MYTFCHARERRKDAIFKEGETKETGEGRFVFPPFNNEGGEIKQESKIASKNKVHGFLKFVFFPFIRNT